MNDRKLDYHAFSGTAMPLKDDYHRDGFVICPSLLDMDTVALLREETIAIASGGRGAINGLPEVNGVAEASDTSGASKENALKQVLAIHFPHKISSFIKTMVHDPRIVNVLTQLIGPDIKCMQSMLFVKNEGKPGQAWHQDETFILTEDRSLIGVWIAIDDATIDNGCLWLHPTSHVEGKLWPSRKIDDARFDGSEESFGWPWDSEGGVAAEVSAGSVVFFNGFTLHRSLNNRRNQGYRRALVNHYMSAQSQLPWKFGASRFAPDDYRDIVMVAGADPYAERGIEDLAQPYLRPENKDLQ
jgi:phytanoyl-CoA hydroxylase